MKTPSQRKKGKTRRKRFKTQLEVDIDNGFDASRFLNPSAANYRNVKAAMDKQRKKLQTDRESLIRKEAEAIAKEKQIQANVIKKMKNGTVFDVIDIDE